MNGCKQIELSLIHGSLNNDCNFVYNDSRYVTTKHYLNLSNITFNKSSTNESKIYLCYFDKNYNFVKREEVNVSSSGSNSVNIDSSYYVKFSTPSNFNNTLKAYQCNVGIGSMSNELAFGSVNFLDTISTLIPFVIILIGFGLGFTLLKRLIKKSSKGSA